MSTVQCVYTAPTVCSRAFTANTDSEKTATYALILCGLYRSSDKLLPQKQCRKHKKKKPPNGKTQGKNPSPIVKNESNVIVACFHRMTFCSYTGWSRSFEWTLGYELRTGCV